MHQNTNKTFDIMLHAKHPTPGRGIILSPFSMYGTAGLAIQKKTYFLYSENCCIYYSNLCICYKYLPIIYLLVSCSFYIVVKPANILINIKYIIYVSLMPEKAVLFKSISFSCCQIHLSFSFFRFLLC